MADTVAGAELPGSGGVRLSPRRMTVVTGVLLFALIGYSIPSNMLVPLLTSLEASYRISAVAAIWISLIALLSGAAFVPTLCRLGDTLSWKKSLVIVGLGCLAVGALISAVSENLAVLLLGRAITGAGLVMFPMLAGIINDEFPVIRRKVAIALMGAFLFLGTGIGGVIAGLIVEHHASFRIVFWGACALPALGIVGMVFGVPNSRGRPEGAPAKWRHAIDLPGAAGFAIPAIALDIAFSEEPAWGWGSWEVIGLLVVAVVVAVAWVAYEWRAPSPMVDQAVFWSRPMWVNNAVSILAGFGLFGALIATSAFAQLPPVPGLGGLGAGQVTGAWVIVPAEWAAVVVGPLTGYLSRRSGKGPFLTGGAVIEGLGLLMVIAFHGSLAALALCMTVVGIGVGMVTASFGLIYVEDIPPEHVGRMFGISPILATGVGGSIGGAVLGTFLSSSTLPRVRGAPPGPPLPSIGAFEGFWALAAGLSLLGACFAAVYLVTYWSGFRGGDRAMVARPLIDADTP
ncbi:MAG: MFS transporter [Nocardiopsaceae bacterium]|nr:MFS transporter [Nocardiopsaceae bacterium]